MTTLGEHLETWVNRARARVARAPLEPRIDEGGRVTRLGDGVAWVSGLPSARLDEILVFEEGTRALAVDLERDEIGCVLLDPGRRLASGARASGTGSIVRVPVG